MIHLFELDQQAEVKFQLQSGATRVDEYERDVKRTDCKKEPKVVCVQRELPQDIVEQETS